MDNFTQTSWTLKAMLNSNEVIPLLVQSQMALYCCILVKAPLLDHLHYLSVVIFLGYLFPYDLLPNSILMALNTFLKPYYDR